jgi:DNA-binding NarL/FixJ family response regulator
LTLVAAAPSSRQAGGAIAVAICAAGRALRARLERSVAADAGLAVAGVVGDPAALERLLEKHRVDVALVQSPAAERLRGWTRRHRATCFVAIVDDAPDAGAEALRAGARALLSHAADAAEIAVTVTAAARGLCVLPAGFLRATQGIAPIADTEEAPLTSRELEVLAAMADGASNKAIARRLGISFHTVKFHVAAILAKLDADSRTEAVTKAAQLGLVML